MVPHAANHRTLVNSKRQQHTHRILTFKTDRKVLATVTLVPVINFQILKCYQKLKTVRMCKCVRKCLRTNNTTVVQENGLKWKALIYIRGWVLISNLYQQKGRIAEGGTFSRIYRTYLQFLDPKSTSNCNINNNDALHSDRYSLR